MRDGFCGSPGELEVTPDSRLQILNRVDESIAGRDARGIHAASAFGDRGALERVAALGRRTMKRRERRAPDVGACACEASQGWAAGLVALLGEGRQRCRGSQGGGYLVKSVLFSLRSRGLIQILR